MDIRSLCVFCGASAGRDPAFAAAAASFGRHLADAGIELVWGGGHVGLMGALADAVLAAGGRTYGVIPGFMAGRELAHPRSTALAVVDSMHARKAAMADRADAFVALPGGFGTLDELFEILTWGQLHLHRKPVGMLNVLGFFDPLLGMLRQMADAGFVRDEHLALLHVAEAPETLLALLRTYAPPEGDWLNGKLGPDRR